MIVKLKNIESNTCLTVANKYGSIFFEMMPMLKETARNTPKSNSDSFSGPITGIVDGQTLMIKEKILRILSKRKVEYKTVFVTENIMKDVWQQQFSVVRYNMSDVIFEIHYYSSDIKDLIHPLFFHLEVIGKQKVDCRLDVCCRDGIFFLKVDSKFIGSWANEIFFSEMFSLKILEEIYKQEEKKWMGFFHAASISNYKKCLIIAGEEGSGKSTLSAILSTMGYDVLADDFLPVESETGMAYRFPTAISLKNGAVKSLQFELPELKMAKEFYDHHKKERNQYFPVKNPAFFEKPDNVPCNAIVFVKYVPGRRITILNVNEEEAFEKFVTEALIHLSEENAFRFIGWFKNLKYYELTYSDSQEMVESIANLFETV